jgi:predicted helicase
MKNFLTEMDMSSERILSAQNTLGTIAADQISINLSITTSRKCTETNDFGTMVSQYIGDIHFATDQTYFFPLYLYRKTGYEKRKSRAGLLMLFEPGANYEGKIPNFKPEFLDALKKTMDKEPIPEEIFNYIYAVLYAPNYRNQYDEFIKIDFPRIPLPENHDVFKKLEALGKELIDLHLVKHQELDETGITVSKAESNLVEKVSYDEKIGKVSINKERYFEGISKEVWEYKIGSYQVMEKYLKDRKGRKLSLEEINHYMRVAKAISLTRALQEKIDGVLG